jgi:hypothetical protein
MRPFTFATERLPVRRSSRFLTGCYQPSRRASREGLEALVLASDVFQHATNVHPYIAGLLVHETAL